MGDVAALGILRPDPGPGVLWAPIRARRCLFGPPDHEFTDKFLETETKKLEQKNRDRWNFDFVRGTPLAGGRYAWTPVIDGDAGGKVDASSEKHLKDDDDSTNSTESKQTQKLITDFMRKRKLSSNQKEKMTPEPRMKTRRRFST
ncbi:uncharacterized protein TNCT_210211 [Trichonephila clavata]|uniref:Cyclin-dependent kinase inhibitor domain-containing protein n=1 Tax=Trichonephila clavata TaxID=2740835 RepID=A0A8X6J7T2_TRICU|nr:uncharacterized protein TNCT_210211 [Trichonephila clavata]